MTCPYEGQNYLVAALKYKLTHITIKLQLVPVRTGVTPSLPDGYNVDRARLYYDALTKKVIEIKRG